MSILERSGEFGDVLKTRLNKIPPDDVAVSIISYEEQVRGWLSRIAGSRSTTKQIELYGFLKRQLNNYCRIAVIDFDYRAFQEFERLRHAKIRVGTMDLKIAAIALANDAMLLSRNLVDFKKVPGLNVEDWTA